MRTFITSLLLAGVAVSAMTVEASAQRRHRVYAPEALAGDSLPLTVNRRSWLDPGPVAPRGTGQAYMAASTQFAKTQDRLVGADRYGNDVMVGQPYVPGRTVPVVEFSTQPNGAVVVDNTIGYQNYYFNPAPDLPAPNSPAIDLEP